MSEVFDLCIGMANICVDRLLSIEMDQPISPEKSSPSPRLFPTPFSSSSSGARRLFDAGCCAVGTKLPYSGLGSPSFMDDCEFSLIICIWPETDWLAVLLDLVIAVSMVGPDVKDPH